MPSVVNEHRKNLLAVYDISLKKELKSAAIMQLKGKSEDTRVNNTLYEKLVYAADNCAITDIKLPEVTFGIEFEFIGSKNATDLSIFNAAMTKLLGDKYFYSGSYTHNDGTSWILGKDSSIKFDGTLISNPFGYELSSPKLNLFNENDIFILNSVIELAKCYLHAEVNKSCGTHIHIGFKHNNIFRGSICDLLTTYSFMEKTVFDPIVPASRRRNRYCSVTRPWPRNKYQKLSSRFCEFSYDGECKNLHFEFRQLEGTLDINTILYWAEFQTYILYDLLDHIDNMQYLNNMKKKNIFEILFRYGFSSSLISFFINRVVDFKSRTLLQALAES